MRNAEGGSEQLHASQNNIIQDTNLVEWLLTTIVYRHNRGWI